MCALLITQKALTKPSTKISWDFLKVLISKAKIFAGFWNLHLFELLKSDGIVDKVSSSKSE